MATSFDVLCGLCEGQDITKHAEQWCPECEEGLCIDCLKFHKSSKATKHHEVMSVENFKKLPDNISSIVHHCKEHDKRYQNYCPHHESLCCPVCITTDHKTCNNLMVIDDIIKTAKSSSLLESIEESIEILKRNLQLLLEEKYRNLDKNKTFIRNFLENLIEAREKINTHFDKLEQQIKQDILAAEKQIKDQTDRFSRELKEKLRTTEKLQKNVEAVKEYASDLQTCLGSIRLKTRVEEEEKYVKCLEINGQLKQILLKCTLDKKNLTAILSVKSLGSVSTYEMPFTVDLFMQGKRRAQVALRTVPIISKSVDEISLTLKWKFEITVDEQQNDITGCAFIPDGRIIIIDRVQSRLLVFSDKGEIKRTVSLPFYRPTDVTSVDDKTIGVTYSGDNRFDLINTDSFMILQTIRTTGKCCGVTSDHEKLYWYERCKGIQMKSQSRDDITTLVKADDDCYWCYVAVYDGRIYQTNKRQGTVSCFNLDGQQAWEFKDKSIFKYPEGITVDKDSNVYVADCYKGIFVLSPDGKTCRQLLRTNNGLCYPVALCYDRINNRLLVSIQTGQVFLYSIS